jgi:phage/conjugal plasmid C-4 type zinc finger TraR family protein
MSELRRIPIVPAIIVLLFICRGVEMATGWAKEGAVQEQIDATIKDGVNRARSHLTDGPSLTHCEECGAKIPPARQKAVAGVRLCVKCQEAEEQELEHFSGYNRRGSKDSQLR